jgi:hypothetical protein
LQSLRGVTLPNEEVMDLLREHFVIGKRNIERDGHVGLSHGYRADQSAVGTTNGAGGRNVQFVVLAADETVMHVLPGFWHAEDLIAELKLGLEVHRLYRREDLSQASKHSMFRTLHSAWLREHGDAVARRSEWQGFDRNYEQSRDRDGDRDTFAVGSSGKRELKTIPQLVHDRLIERPFRKFADFGMETFVDYGRPFYDNNQGLDKGREFPRAEHANAKREREQQKAREQAEQEAKKAEKANRAKTRAAKSRDAQPLAEKLAEKLAG